MAQPVPERSQRQVAEERAAAEVSDVLLNLDHALDRARRAHKRVGKDGVDVNAELALGDLVKELRRLRKRFTQDTLYAGDAQRML